MRNESIIAIRETISGVFAEPEQYQAAAWVDIIESMDSMIANKNYNASTREIASECREVYISIASEAKPVVIVKAGGEVIPVIMHI